MSIAFIQHVGWLRHDLGEEMVHLLRQGHFEAAEQAFFWLYLRSDDTFIDCGAHIGLYSVLASKATDGGVSGMTFAYSLRKNKFIHYTQLLNPVGAAVCHPIKNGRA